MTGAQIRLLCTGLGLKPDELAWLLGVSVSAVYRWQSHSLERVPLGTFHAMFLNRVWTCVPRKEWAALGRKIRACPQDDPLEAMHIILREIYG